MLYIALPLPMTLSVQVGVYVVHSTAIICDTECTGGC